MMAVIMAKIVFLAAVGIFFCWVAQKAGGH